MATSERKLNYLLWAVVGVLVVGIIIESFILIDKNNQLSAANAALAGDVSSLHNQVKEAESQTPTPTPQVTAAPTPPPAATPTPVVAPTPTPKP